MRSFPMLSDRRVSVVAPDDDPVSRMDEAFVNCLLRTKYKYWKYEDRVRVFIDPDERTVENGLYFYPFPPDICLRQVILGPLCELPKEQCVRWRRASMKEYLIIADLARKRFAVVRSKEERKRPSPCTIYMRFEGDGPPAGPRLKRSVNPRKRPAWATT